jgi:hypothetical protein
VFNYELGVWAYRRRKLPTKNRLIKNEKPALEA